MRLVYSPDDFERHSKGWYWETMDWRVSQLFATAEEARLARINNLLIWESTNA